MNLSIITVTFNCGEILEACISSVRSQRDVDVEYIVIDGGSTDSTLNVIRKNNAAIDQVISEDDDGLYDALNKGIALATGDVVGILHSDDFYHDDTVLYKIARIFEDPEVQACYGDLKYVAPENTDKIVRYWRAGKYKPGKFYWGWMPPHPTFFVRKSIYEDFGLFNLELGSAADYEIMLRFLLKHNANTVYLPETLVHMRTGGISNASVANRLKANVMDRKAWIVNNLKPYPWTLYFKPLRKVLQWVRK